MTQTKTIIKRSLSATEIIQKAKLMIMTYGMGMIEVNGHFFFISNQVC